jgi:pyruvate kinase
MKKTKIICTIGPASEDREILKSMMTAGMNAARLNFSHGTHEEQKRKIDLVKALREELDLPIAIILDTKGPEIRTGQFGEKEVELFEGQKFTLTMDDVLGTNKICSVSYKGLIGDVKPGDQILVDDGLIGMTVDEVKNDSIVCTVNNGGVIKDYKSINVPGVTVKLPAITDKDKEDIVFGIGEGVDYIAASFVRKGSDVEEMRAFLKERGAGQIKIISRILSTPSLFSILEMILILKCNQTGRGSISCMGSN